MPDFRLYLKNDSGLTVRRVDLFLTHPVAAQRRAEELTQQGPVELWEGTRLIQKFPAATCEKTG